MERVCSQAVNRLVRTRMLGGVGGVRREPAPIPIHIVIPRFLVKCSNLGETLALQLG